MPVGHSTREFCGCATHPEGEECGMVVCWKCEQIVSKVDDEGAITTAWMQAENERLREALRHIAGEQPSAAYCHRVARAALAAQVQKDGPGEGR